MEIQLGAIESAVAGVYFIFLADAGDGICQGIRRNLPVLLCADMVIRHGGKLDLVGQTEHGVNLIKEAGNADDLILDLLLGQQDVRIILGKAANTEHPVQGSGKLVAMDTAQLAVAQRQIAVGMRLQIVD